MQDEQFDAIVIGSGQGGNPLAKAMAKKGWKTAVIERRYVGGTCVNDGCTPSKTIDASAKVAYLVRRAADFGVHTGPVSIDLAKVWQRKQKLVLSGRENNTKGLTQLATSDLLMGEAEFAEVQPGGGVHRIHVRLNDGGERTLVAPRVILNTGERPDVPAIDGLQAVPFLDSTSIMELKVVPRHLVILGAGYIALEFAQMFLRFGAKVTVLERGERIAAHEDADVAECLRSILAEDGLEIVTCSAVTRASGGEGMVNVQAEVDGQPRTLTGSHLMIAAGRTPNVEALHLERVGAQQDSRGHVVVNDRLETSAPGIWAIGDVKGGPAFTHVSYDDFRIVRDNLLEGKQASTHDRLLVYTMFTDPELGRVGMTETEARQKGHRIRVASLPMTYMARATEMDESRGMMKAVVDAETDQILGATILGVDGGEVAAQIQIAMMGKLPSAALREGMFSHPTRSEALNTLFGALGEPS